MQKTSFGRDFLLVVIGQIISLFGNAILRFALTLYLLRQTGSPALFTSNQSLMLTVTPCLLDNPRFLAMQIAQLYQIVAPGFIQPILQQGIDDGSIQASNPRELAESIMVLSNVWLNPLVSMTDEAGMRRRCQTFNALLQGAGVRQLLDEEMIEGYLGYCRSQRRA